MTADDVLALIKKRFNIVYKRSGAYALMKKLRISKVKPRPVHEKNDLKIMAYWRDDLPVTVRKIMENNKNKNLEFYFQDETRYGQKTIHTGIWSIKGHKPRFKTQVGYINGWLYGAINPITGDHHGFILPRLDSTNMQIFIDSFAKMIPKKSHRVLILDGSSAHRNTVLKLPKSISLVFLPPYSPELNPIEKLWGYIKRNFLSFKIYKNYDDILNEGSKAWNNISNKVVQSICKCDYLTNILEST